MLIGAGVERYYWGGKYITFIRDRLIISIVCHTCVYILHSSYSDLKRKVRVRHFVLYPSYRILFHHLGLTDIY